MRKAFHNPKGSRTHVSYRLALVLSCRPSVGTSGPKQTPYGHVDHKGTLPRPSSLNYGILDIGRHGCEPSSHLNPYDGTCPYATFIKQPLTEP